MHLHSCVLCSPHRVFAMHFSLLIYQSWRDSRASFILPDNNSSIKRWSANPVLDTDVHLNPPGGSLRGTDRATAFGGWVYFRDLFVRVRGSGYKINFEAFVPTAQDVVAASSLSSSSSTSSTDEDPDSFGGVMLKQSTIFEVGGTDNG